MVGQTFHAVNVVLNEVRQGGNSQNGLRTELRSEPSDKPQVGQPDSLILRPDP